MRSLACPLPPSPLPTTAAPCPEGFSGAGCALCQTDAACAASTGDPAATCSSSLAFAPTSQLKSYSCSLPPDGLLGSLLEPGSLVVQCSTGLAPGQTLPSGGRRLAQAAGPSCSIGFVVASPRVEVKCAASSCTFAAGQSSLTCASTSCACAGDATCGANGEWGAAGFRAVPCLLPAGGCRESPGSCLHRFFAGLPCIPP